MPKLDRYLTGDFLQSFLATLIVLLVVSLGGVLVDVLGNIADGGLPARLMLSQLGLQLLVYLPLVLPLALMLGLMLAVARLYRDSEMAVLNAVGVGPRDEGLRVKVDAQHVGDLGDRHQPRAVIEQCVELLELQRPVNVERNDPQLRANALAEHLPRHDIGVVLHLGDDNIIPRVDLRVAPAVSD